MVQISITNLLAMVIDTKVRLDIILVAEVLAFQNDKFKHASGTQCGLKPMEMVLHVVAFTSQRYRLWLRQLVVLATVLMS
jgi:ABC-type polysaccharide/polyol phosphate transport system ATPase subunit